MSAYEARAEAERRYSGRGEVALTAGAIRNARREAFEQGAEWQASRKVEVSDELVARVREHRWYVFTGRCACGEHINNEAHFTRHVLGSALGGKTEQ